MITLYRQYMSLYFSFSAVLQECLHESLKYLKEMDIIILKISKNSKQVI